MSSVDPSDISGLIDGELSSERQGIIRGAIEENPFIRCEFEELTSLHEEWLKALESINFQPQVSLPRDSCPLPFHIPTLVFVLLVLRFVLKMIPVWTAGILQGVLFMVVVFFLIQRLLRIKRCEMISTRWILSQREV